MSYVVEHQPTNGMGTAGFVTSLVGFLTCGCLSPLGLLFSFIGLLQPPRGMAFAGAILGLIGCIWLWLAGAAMILGFVGLSGAANEMRDKAKQIQMEREANEMSPPIEKPMEEAK